jgi:hypothetical protein
MGLAFGDLNCDGKMDLFGSSFGDYGFPNLGTPVTVGDHSSRWMLGTGDGSFNDDGIGSLIATPFGWGTAIFDYDNDGDQDITFNGGMDVNLLVLSDNPGTVLQNQGCSSNFVWDRTAFATNYARQNVQGLAVGDLNHDGFVDIVTASNFSKQPETLIPLVFPGTPLYGSVFDPFNAIVPTFFPTSAGFVWSGFDFQPGTMTVEINSANNGNKWVKVKTVGTKGITTSGVANRDVLVPS